MDRQKQKLIELQTKILMLPDSFIARSTLNKTDLLIAVGKALKCIELEKQLDKAFDIGFYANPKPGESFDEMRLRELKALQQKDKAP